MVLKQGVQPRLRSLTQQNAAVYNAGSAAKQRRYDVENAMDGGCSDFETIRTSSEPAMGDWCCR